MATTNWNVGDSFIFHSDNGTKYEIKIININDYREPSMRYGCDIYNETGCQYDDVLFIGDDFLKKNKSKIEKLRT